MVKTLQHYIPDKAVGQLLDLLQSDNLIIKIKNQRRTRHGDYKHLPNGKHQITVNNNLNKYRFLITLIHEVAHLKAYKTYGKSIKPHGKEWKHTFQQCMLPFINPSIFPHSLLPLLAKHFKNPKASSDTDTDLSLALKQFDAPNDKSYIFEIPQNKHFRIYNGKVFKKGKQRRKRFECLELKTGKMYLFNPNAEVDLLN